LKYNPRLDGLRGVAVLLVMCFHLGVPGFGNGAIGVDIFFVLSGYLISNVLLNRQDGLSEFYWRRFLRLFPAMALVCLALLAVRPFLTDPEQPLVDVLYGALYVANWTRVWGPGDPRYLGHLWSVAIEEQFYLLWPAIFATLVMFRRRTSVALTALLVAASIAWRLHLIDAGAPIARIYNGSDTRADQLLIGCVLALCIGQGSGHSLVERWTRRLAPSMLSCLVLLTTLVASDAPWMLAFGHTAAALATAVLLAAVAQPAPGWLQSCLAWRPLIGVGKISYGLYLWHYPVSLMLLLGGVPLLVRIVLTFVISFIAAALSFRFVERPILRFRVSVPPERAKVLGAAAATLSLVGIAVGVSAYWRADIEFALDPTPMQIEAYGPESLTPGGIYNTQPDGRSAFWFRGSRRIPKDTRLVIGGQVQPAASINGSILVVVGPEIHGIGTMSMQFIGPDGQPRSTSVPLQIRLLPKLGGS